VVSVTLRSFENRSSKLTLQRRAYIKIGTPTFGISFLCAFLHRYKAITEVYRGADKSLARPGRKQATATKL